MSRITAFAMMTTAAVLAGCADAPEPFAAAPAPASLVTHSALDISGSWHYVETVHLVLKPGDEVIDMTCINPDGVLTIVQTGASFTGTLTHPTTTCVTRDGSAAPPPWDLPYVASLSGTVTGRAIHFEQYDAPPSYPVRCPKNGSLTVAGGAVTAMSTRGRCDLSFLPFPITAINSASATRQ
jgi:hypothetical protein